MDDRSRVGAGRQLNAFSQELFGVLAVNKPRGKTSRDVVNHVQRMIRPTKIGHTGTLDPLATGVLLLALGKATRLVEYAHLQPKNYVADFVLGQTSDTLDVDGKVQPLPDAPLIDRDTWLTRLTHFRGKIQQTPPKFSACRINGQHAYDLARQGAEFELASREVTIHELELLEFAYPNVKMSIQCSSGTYIRSLGHDIAASLGSAGVMSQLVRTAIGRYTLSDCASEEQLTSLAAVHQALRSPVGLVDQFPRIQVSEVECDRLRTGSTIEGSRNGETFPTSQTVVAVDSNEQLVAILESRGELLQPTRVFLS
jgi:tRNA pseudouridine55 synthase